MSRHGPNIRPRRASQRQRIWSAMRILRAFDLEQLGDVAEVTYVTCRLACSDLCRTGYLRQHGLPSRSSQAVARVSYRLVRDTGPHAPRTMCKGEVYDPNNHTYYGVDGTQRQLHGALGVCLSKRLSA